MRYIDGDVARLGDLVEFDPDLSGIVVCSVDTNEFNDEYPELEWKDYLSSGILVMTSQIGLVHLEVNDVNLRRRPAA